MIPEEKRNALRQPWQQFQVDAAVSDAEEVFLFWRIVASLATTGSPRSGLLVELATALLNIPHSSAGIERNFSQMGEPKTSARSSLSTRILSNLMTI